jgi:hypothetical protein
MPQPTPNEHPVVGPEYYDPCRPTLPAGYQAQEAWGFRDQDGGVLYEFSRVYGPAVDNDGRGPVAQLDQNLSYWSVIWPITGQTDDQHRAGRWITYGQAHRMRDHLSFERFSSPGKMGAELPELFRGH